MAAGVASSFATTGLDLPTSAFFHVGTIFLQRLDQDGRAKCTDRMLIYGERRLRSVLNEYIDHYHGHRPPDQNEQAVVSMEGQIEHHEILGGAINEYRRAAWPDQRNPRSDPTREL
ncbi:hypothetical protein [Nonomuraea sp. NPDC049625]|uniref:hypothetical protein n=1 Tax=Nonomuraea sp. NPDC049625 TaxID=3155775 RepID=UPI0034207609